MERIIKVNEFKCVDDEGKIYIVEEWRKRIDTSNSLERSSMLGLPDFRLKGGGHVNLVKDEPDKFQIVGRDIFIRKIG